MCVPLGHAHQSVSDLVPPGPGENKGCAWVLVKQQQRRMRPGENHGRRASPQRLQIFDVRLEGVRRGERLGSNIPSPVEKRSGNPECVRREEACVTPT